MQSRSRFWIPAVALAFASGFGVTQDPDPNAQLQERVTVLEEQIEQIEIYLQNQADSTKALAGSLDQSEKEGFTWGINPLSREILMEAWRSQIATAQKGVPGAKKSQTADAGR